MHDPLTYEARLRLAQASRRLWLDLSTALTEAHEGDSDAAVTARGRVKDLDHRIDQLQAQA